MSSPSTVVRRALGAAKRRSLRYRPGPRRDVALFGQRRGGSSFLADGIALQPGVFVVNEPFAAWPGHGPFSDRIRELLPARPHRQLFALAPEEQAQVRAYVQGLRDGTHRFGGRHLRFGEVVERTLLKILNAPALIDWFAGDLGMDTVLLCRHPASQALSVLRQGWGFSAEAYFHSDAWCERHFSPPQVELGRRILAGSDRWSKAILNWIVEAQLPLRAAPATVLKVTYEGLLLRPRETFGAVAGHLGLEVTERFVQMANRPSGSTRMSSDRTRQRIQAGDRAYLLARWQDELDPKAKDTAQRILDAFEVTLYRMDDPLPEGLAGREAAP